MKKLIAVLAVMFSVNAAAFTGTGNKDLDEAREFMRWQNDEEVKDLYKATYWLGLVSGASVVFDSPTYHYAICYPENSSSLQIAEIAARYVIDNPSERAKGTEALIWVAHFEAFGFKDSDDCWEKKTKG